MTPEVYGITPSFFMKTDGRHDIMVTEFYCNGVYIGISFPLLPYGDYYEKPTFKTQVKEAITLIPRLLRLLFRTMGDRRLHVNQVLLLGTILYVLSPGFLPDFIPFTGQVDDILLLAVVILSIMQQVGHSVFQERWKDQQSLSDMARRILKRASSFSSFLHIRTDCKRFRVSGRHHRCQALRT